MMNIGKQDLVHFKYICSIGYYLDMKFSQLIDIDIGNIFGEKFVWFGGLRPKSRRFST